MFGRLFLLVCKLVSKYRQIAKYEKMRETLFTFQVSRSVQFPFNLNFGAKNHNWTKKYKFRSAR